jgi:hypothetical protein
MRYLLWKVAQHKHGWSYVSRHQGELQVAEALVRRGYVTFSILHPRDGLNPKLLVTADGIREIERRWPISPFVLGTYEPQPGGWSLPDGRTESEARRIPLPDTTKETTTDAT